MISNIVDYTALPIGRRTECGRRIARCPLCGRNGEYIRYRGGDENYAHIGRREFGLVSIEEHCYVRKARQ